MTAWAETAPGLWQRAIGENEALIKLIGETGRRFEKDVWSISVTATFTLRLEDETQKAQKLRDAWKALRFYHPSLASFADQNTLKYSIPDAQSLERWMTETFVLVETDNTPEDVITNMKRHRFARLYYLPKHDAVLLNISHYHTDGIGAFMLLDAYLAMVVESFENRPDRLLWGEEVTRLVPTIEDALDLPLKSTDEVQHATDTYLNTVKHYVGAVETPYKPGTDNHPKGTRSVHIRCSRNETLSLQTGCLRNDISMAAAVHASVAATAYSIADIESGSKHYSSTLRHSIRPYLPTPFDGVAGAAGLFTAGYIVKVPAHQSWLENAKQYQTEYSRGATPDLLCSRRQYAVTMKEILVNQPQADSPASGLDFSWIPNADALVQPFHSSTEWSLEVRDISIGVDVLSRHMYVFMWLFRGQLGLKMVYNESFYDADMAQATLNYIKIQLLRNLLH
ncbi:hypothetical protein KCV07_g8821, partial [Aureobasidium melanogenum]